MYINIAYNAHYKMECESVKWQNKTRYALFVIAVDVFNIMIRYVCIILFPFLGEFCEIKHDPCFSSPCARNATCSSDGLHFFCNCPVDFTGTLCDVCY